MRSHRHLLPAIALLLSLAACTGGGSISPEARRAGAGQDTSVVEDTIIVTSPHAQSIVEPGFTATGLARGPWYMEATFPVELVADDGTVLASGSAEAKDDWMTNDFVPFEVTLTWPATPLTSATLVLRNANPSGDAQNAKEVRIPVQLAHP